MAANRAGGWRRPPAGRLTVLAGGLVFCLLPLVWTLLAALGWQPDGRAWRGALTFANFAGVVVFEPAFGAEFACWCSRSAPASPTACR